MDLSHSELSARLESAGIKPTAQRLAICRYIFTEADHATAEDVKVWMDQNFPKVSLATVYNTLNLFVKAGVLQELHFPHLEKAVYDTNTRQHFHFYDQETGELTDLEPSQLAVTPRLEDNFEVQVIHAVLIGRKKAG